MQATAKPTGHQSEASQPTVTVLNGTLRGVYSPEYGQDFFLGIPFAQPPVGQLRFRNPQSLNTSWNGVKEVTQYSPECIGYGSDDWILGNVTSEDCLNLNVVRPRGVGGPLPVGVWIFGGGLTEGGSADPRYNLSFIVQQSVEAGHPFIGVSINYRLQAWGFLYGNELAAEGSSNMGVRDQRMALSWVQDNIAAFGGDPEKVTIWGESAGATSVGCQLVAYGGRDDGLFRGAVMESGTTIGKSFANASSWEKTYQEVVNATNCATATDTLSCLRDLDVNHLSSVLNSSAISGSWGPAYDGDFIQGQSGTTMMLRGDFVKVPILHGRNHDEGTSFATKGINTTEQFLAVLTKAGYDNATALTLAALYPDIPAVGIPGTLDGRPPASNASLGSMWKRASAYAGDHNQHAPRRMMSRVWANYSIPSYSYLFNVWPAGIDVTTGVTHFTEVSFVFHNILGGGYNNSIASDPFAGKPESYVDVSTMMSRMWASFIDTLNPNHSGS